MNNTLYKASRHWKEIELWKDVTDEQWNDWVWQLTNTIKTLEDLKKVINLTPQEEEGVKIATKTIPLNITPYYAWLMDENDPKCPIRMQSVPISEYILKNLRDIPHVEIIRIGTRAPVVFPQRITENLCNILKKYHPVWLNTHFNTSIEITEESKRACEM